MTKYPSKHDIKRSGMPRPNPIPSATFRDTTSSSTLVGEGTVVVAVTVIVFVRVDIAPALVFPPRYTFVATGIWKFVPLQQSKPQHQVSVSMFGSDHQQ